MRMNANRGFRTLAFVTALAIGGVAVASAPMVGTPPPGYYRLKVGDFEITPVNDGVFGMDLSKLLAGAKAGEIKAALDKNFLQDPVDSSVNAFLINTGDKLVLVDTGAGTLFGPKLGKFLENFKASGYKPEQIDIILITHMHPDHVGGLTADGKIVFPNAVVYTDKAESDFWMSEDNLNKAPAENKDFFKGAMASLKPYVTAGKHKTFTADTEIVPGITSHASHGHTSGHTTYMIESKGQKLVLLGDLLHVAAVQFENPLVTIHFDSDPKHAQAERKAAFADAAKSGYMIGAAHLPFPGIGHIRAEKKAYTFVPANYTR